MKSYISYTLIIIDGELWRHAFILVCVCLFTSYW